MYNIACAILFAAMTYRFLNVEPLPEPTTKAEMIAEAVPCIMWIASFFCAILP